MAMSTSNDTLRAKNVAATTAKNQAQLNGSVTINGGGVFTGSVTFGPYSNTMKDEGAAWTTIDSKQVSVEGQTKKQKLDLQIKYDGSRYDGQAIPTWINSPTPCAVVIATDQGDEDQFADEGA